MSLPVCLGPLLTWKFRFQDSEHNGHRTEPKGPDVYRSVQSQCSPQAGLERLWKGLNPKKRNDEETDVTIIRRFCGDLRIKGTVVIYRYVESTEFYVTK